MEKVTIIKIFLASPNDVKNERQLIFALKNELDHIIGKPNSIRFEFINWENSAYPGVGEDSQDVINNQIGKDFNVFIGIFWQRFGTPTNRSESGTKEEFDIAFEKYKKNPHSTHIMLYFKTSAPDNIYEIDYQQFEKVKKFKEEIRNKGVLYWEFETTEQLRNFLLLHLSTLVNQKYIKAGEDKVNKKSIVEENLNKHELLARNIDSNDFNSYGLIELSQKTSDTMKLLPNICGKISLVINYIGTKFHDKTNEINSIKNIKDERLRFKKLTLVMDQLADEFDHYSKKIEEYIPEFSEVLNTAIESYTKLLLLASKSNYFLKEAKQQLNVTFPELYKIMDGTLSSIGVFLKALSGLPPLTSKFGNSKRKAELATNNIFKELISAQKIMGQLIERNDDK